FSLEKIWYIPRKELYMSKKGTRTVFPSASSSGNSPRKSWDAKIAARNVRRNTKRIRFSRPLKFPKTIIWARVSWDTQDAH
ncbi:MAG: hypothetical protein M1823_007602, partial [Watsoniomyces obsoletus]